MKEEQREVLWEIGGGSGRKGGRGVVVGLCEAVCV